MTLDALGGDFNGPPHDDNAEAAILGSILINNRAYLQCKPVLRAQHFYNPVHARLYEAVAEMIEADRLADHLTMINVLNQEPGIAPEEGRKYIGSLARAAETILNVSNYAVHVRDLCHKRLIAESCIAALQRTGSGDPTIAPSKILTELDRDLKLITKDMIDDLIHPVGDVMRRLQSIVERKVEPISTGLYDLDKALDGGLRVGDLYGIEASHGSFKTGTLGTFALAMMKSRVPFLFVTLEMADAMILARLVSAETGCNARRLMDPDASEEATRRIDGFAQAYGDVPGYFAHRPGITRDALASLISSAVSRFGVKVVFVDYWQRIKGRPVNQVKSEFLEDVADWMADFAAVEQVAVVMASQLNRQGQGFGSGGLDRASAFLAHLKKVEGKDRIVGDFEAMWLEVAKSRFSLTGDIGDENNPAFRIDGVGPVLKGYGDWTKNHIKW